MRVVLFPVALLSHCQFAKLRFGLHSEEARQENCPAAKVRRGTAQRSMPQGRRRLGPYTGGYRGHQVLVLLVPAADQAPAALVLLLLLPGQLAAAAGS